MFKKIHKYIIEDRLRNKEWIQKIVIELTTDALMITIGVVVAYYIKTTFWI